MAVCSSTECGERDGGVGPGDGVVGVGGRQPRSRLRSREVTNLGSVQIGRAVRRPLVHRARRIEHKRNQNLYGHAVSVADELQKAEHRPARKSSSQAPQALASTTKGDIPTLTHTCTTCAQSDTPHHT